MSIESISKLHLLPEEIVEARVLYEEKGWKILWLAKKYNVNHTVIINLINRQNFIRKSEVLEKKPDEVKAVYRTRLREARAARDEFEESEDFADFRLDDEEEIPVKSYATIMKEATQRRSHTPDSECSHSFWQQRCSTCKAILSSDSQQNSTPSKEPVQFVYNELDSLVCSYRVSIDLQTLGVKQQSALYWIYYENTHAVTLRLRTNLPERTDENALIASAFTSQELFKLLANVHPTLKDDCFMRKLALNGGNPVYLGKLLCRCIRKIERLRARKLLV